MGRGTTKIGFVNDNRQEVLRDTGLSGTDHGRRVYEVRCQLCDHRYRGPSGPANGQIDR